MNSQVAKLPTEAADLLERLKACFISVIANIAEMAAIVRKLDELGVEVAIENSFLPYIRLVAHGQLLSECFTSCLGDHDLLERAMRLPLPLQESIANNEPFKVMELGGDHRLVRPLDMTRRERSQVFAGKRLRTDTEQIGWLREQFESDRAKRMPVRPDDSISVDRRRRGIVANGIFIPLAQLADYVAALSR